MILDALHRVEADGPWLVAGTGGAARAVAAAARERKVRLGVTSRDPGRGKEFVEWAQGLGVVLVGEAAVAAWFWVAPVPGRMSPRRGWARFAAALGTDMLIATQLLQLIMVGFLILAWKSAGVAGFAAASASTVVLHAILKRLNDTRVESERRRRALVEMREVAGGLLPLRQRERVRLEGPSILHDVPGYLAPASRAGAAANRADGAGTAPDRRREPLLAGRPGPRQEAA